MRYTVLSLFLITCGCAILPARKNFPSSIKPDCDRAMSESKALIESSGARLGSSRTISVVVHPCNRKVNGFWSWQHESGAWVGGRCLNAKTIEIGAGPDGSIFYPALLHEFAHYWLFPVGGPDGHDPAYRGMFVNWRD